MDANNDEERKKFALVSIKNEATKPLESATLFPCFRMPECAKGHFDFE